MTGFRPIEVARLTMAQLDFSEADKPLIVNRITKTKKKVYHYPDGRVMATKLIKVKRRIIPVWVKEYLEKYIRMHYNTFNPDDKGSFYLFSRPKKHKPHRKRNLVQRYG